MRDRKRIFLLPTLCVTMASLVWFAGCSQAPSPDVQAEASLKKPGTGPTAADALAGETIAPPELGDIAGATASYQVNGDTLVQTVADEGAEVVPTPKGKELVPAPDGKKDEPGDIGEPEDYNSWEKPAVALFLTGQQHGYIEPCGCTGLDKQKGGMARRFTFMKQLRDKGWDLLPLDGGNQVRRFGRQSEIKLQQTARALHEMDYYSVGFGPDDLRLGVGELLSVAAGESEEEMIFVSSNVVLVDREFTPDYRVIKKGGLKIGVTTILDPEELTVPVGDEIIVDDPNASLRATFEKMRIENPDFTIVTFFGKEERAKLLMQNVVGFDLIVVAGGYGEPMYKPAPIKRSTAKMILTGNKGMYAGVVGVYPDKSYKYARVPLTHEFEDAPEMRKLMSDYQDQLRDLGLSSLGVEPIPHPTGRKFVGSKKCGECHTTAYDIWEGSAHFEATEHIVKPPKERGDIARHFDPECISCHVTGWNPQNYYPYASGYLSLEASQHLLGNGCENCHGPGAEHSAAEAEGSGATDDLLAELRDQMKLSLENAREKCMECHDLDNSPDFHQDDAFEDEYWPEIEHYGLD